MAGVLDAFGASGAVVFFGAADAFAVSGASERRGVADAVVGVAVGSALHAPVVGCCSSAAALSDWWREWPAPSECPPQQAMATEGTPTAATARAARVMRLRFLFLRCFLMRDLTRSLRIAIGQSLLLHPHA
ncbi:hypothetical protein [Streptomyces albospinus]|nr:hypothetical protein [Streptomyces albospinus]